MKPGNAAFCRSQEYRLMPVWQNLMRLGPDDYESDACHLPSRATIESWFVVHQLHKHFGMVNEVTNM